MPAVAALQPLPLGHFAHVVFDLLLQHVELLDVARLGELGQQVHVDDADLRRLCRLFELLEQLVDLLQLLLDGERLGNRQRLRPVNSYLAASSSTWYLSPSLSTKLHDLPGEFRAVVAGAK